MKTAAHENLIVVLSEPQDLVNIAGAIRAMLNMGQRRLRLVNPGEYDEVRIRGIAHRADVVLERIEMFDSLREATADVGHVVGTTARRRESPYVWQHPRAAAPELVELSQRLSRPIALVFGREDAGLSNEQLDRCDRILTIPTDPAHSSLNLAQAVLLVTYELWLAGAAEQATLPRPRRMAEPASAEEIEQLFESAEETLTLVEFFKKRNPAGVLRTLRALARRAGIDAREAKLLRAMALKTRKTVLRRSPP